MDNQNHRMSTKQTKLIVNAHKHNLLNSLCNNEYVYVKQHENNNNDPSKIKREREMGGGGGGRERYNALMPVTV